MVSTEVAEDTPTSQDATTLVPMSLGLVAKKEKILQAEVTKLQKLLKQRNETLCGLRESHEYLLTTNGQLQERSRMRREKLVALRTLLDANQEQGVESKPGLCEAIGMNELEATAEKCDVLKEILLGLEDKRTGLEQQCMGFEEQTARDKMALRKKEERLNEVRNTLYLLHEDIHSSQWSVEDDQAELTEADKRLNIVSQNAARETTNVERLDAASRTGKVAIGDLQTNWQNHETMAHEEHRQLAIVNEDARREQRELQRMLDSNGATCPADEEVLESAKDLQLKLQHLNEEVTSAKFFKRELALRKKQEKDMLDITQSTIKAKDEQLNWMERQRVHLENEQTEATKSHAADEAAYQTFIEEHNAEMASLETQIKDAGKQMKITERAIATCNKKVAAANKKVAQKTKVLDEWNARINAKQEQVAKSAATQELVDAEVLSMQEKLDQELRHLEHSQQLRTTQEMESAELCAACAALETDMEQAHKTLTAMKSSISATQTAVKNRIDEVRDKFLRTFVVGDAEILIELLNKEIESWTTKERDEVDETIVSEAKLLEARYADLAADTRKKHNKVLRHKEKQYKAKLAKLKAKEAEVEKTKAAASAAKKATMDNPADKTIRNRVSATNHKPEADKSKEVEERNEAESQNFDPPRVELPNSELIANKPAAAKKQPAKPKTNGVSKQAPKSARRQLALGLNLVGDSPQTDNELTDIPAADSTAVTTTEAAESAHSSGSKQRNTKTSSNGHRPRLKRRTPAQKAGKTAPVTTRISPEVPTPVNNMNPVLSGHSNPATEAPSQDSLDSPVGCDEDLASSRPAQGPSSTHMTKKATGIAAPSIASQGAAKKPLLQKGGQRSKGAIKHRPVAKISHRSRLSKVSKVNRASLGRSQVAVDWTAADSFSFA